LNLSLYVFVNKVLVGVEILLIKSASLSWISTQCYFSISGVSLYVLIKATALLSPL
jgi:hypothetical protein